MYVAPHRQVMRVLLATPYSLHSPSGVSSFVRAIDSRIRLRGTSPIIVEPGGEARIRGIANLWLARRTARAIFRGRKRIDIVHCQQLHPQAVVASIVSRILGKRVIVTVHGRSPRPDGLRGLAFDFVERAALVLPHEVVFVSHDLRRTLGGRGFVIPNGVSVDAIRSSLAARDAVRSELGITDSHVVLYYGRVTADKGVLTLIDAFEEVRKSASSDLRLVLIGPVEERIRHELERKVSASAGAISLLGVRSNPCRYLTVAHVFVLPSLREGLPISLLEAMAAGVPVIASNVGDIPEIVKDRETGLLISPGDVGALAAAIEWVIENPEGAARMGRLGADLIARDFDFDKVWECYSAVYDATFVR